MKEIIHTNVLPPSIGPYSAAVRAGDFIFLSGQISYCMEEKVLKTGDITEETSVILSNIRKFLEDNNLSFGQVVKTTIYLTDLSLFEQMNTVYNEYFRESLPARSCVEVSRLPKNVNVEIECIIYARPE